MSPLLRTAGAVVCAGLLATAACTTAAAPAPPPRTVSASDLRGKTVDEATAQLGRPALGDQPNRLQTVYYDLTYTVSPELNSGDTSSSDELVVASCFTDVPVVPGGEPDPRIVLGVVPARYATAEVRARTRARGFDDRLVECPGTSDRFTVPQE